MVSPHWDIRRRSVWNIVCIRSWAGEEGDGGRPWVAPGRDGLDRLDWCPCGFFSSVTVMVSISSVVVWYRIPPPPPQSQSPPSYPRIINVSSTYHQCIIPSFHGPPAFRGGALRVLRSPLPILWTISICERWTGVGIAYEHPAGLIVRAGHVGSANASRHHVLFRTEFACKPAEGLRCRGVPGSDI